MEMEEEGKLAFLDIGLMQQPNGFIGRFVYRKPTHTNLYRPNDSFHHPTQKCSALTVLGDRAYEIVDANHLQDEQEFSVKYFQTTWDWPLMRFVRQFTKSGMEQSNKIGKRTSLKELPLFPFVGWLRNVLQVYYFTMPEY